MSDYRTIIVRVEDNHADIRLNRPEVRNALNTFMVNEIKSAFDALEKDASIKTITISGSGKAFCSGADIGHMKNLRSNSFDENLADSRNLAEMFSRIYHCPKPTVAVVDGPALAGGCGLASVCDFVLASEKAIFGYPEVKIGFVAAIVSGYLIRQIGERNARDLMLTGRIVSAQDAKNMGLINIVCDCSSLKKESTDLVQKLQQNSAMAMKISKEVLANFNGHKISEDLENLAELNAHIRETPEFKEGVNAFIEKRKPNWIKN